MTESGPSRLALHVTAGPNPGGPFILREPTMLLGRDATCEITIPAADVSRHHARLRLTLDGLTVEDLNSTNGTWVNGVRVHTPTPLNLGDILRVGGSELIVAATTGPARQAAPGPAATYDVGDVAGSVVAGTGNLVAGRDQYVAGGNLHHGDNIAIDVTKLES